MSFHVKYDYSMGDVALYINSYSKKDSIDINI